MRQNYDWLIVGSGLFGATFAREMLARGEKVLVVERRNKIGGNIRCEEFNGVLMHAYGAHIFHTSKKDIWDYVAGKIPLKPITHSPLAITDDGRAFSLPFNMYTFNALWGVKTPEEARKKLEEQTRYWREKYSTPTNLEEKALSLVGEDLYVALIKGYTQKQWGVSDCRELPPEIITRIPLRFTWDLSYFDDTYVGIPEGGYNPLIESLLSGADILTGVDFLKYREELSKKATNILFTGCIDEYYGYIFGHLGYRSLRFETKIEPLEETQGCSVVNYTGRSVPYTRVIEHNAFAPKRYYEELVKSYEYPAGVQQGGEPYYPIINEKNRALYAKYAELAQTQANIHFGGRLGMYQYMDMDDAIEAAIALSKNV